MPSLYDEDMYSLPHISEGSSPSASQQQRAPQGRGTVSAPKADRGVTRWCSWKYLKRCVTITCLVIGLVAAAIVVTVFIAESKGNMTGICAFVNLV